MKSTGPITPEGKDRSRQNAIRHGLTAETVIAAFEDSADYEAFEAAVTADYDAEMAVERELVLRLASVLWRLRRSTLIETGLFASIATKSEQGGGAPKDLADCFMKLSNLQTSVHGRISRYEHMLWRQARQLVYTLNPFDDAKAVSYVRRLRFGCNPAEMEAYPFPDSGSLAFLPRQPSHGFFLPFARGTCPTRKRTAA